MESTVYEIYQCLEREGAGDIDDRVVLDHLQREKGRFKTLTQSGAELRIFLERGNRLAIGAILRSDCGRNFEVVGAREEVARATAEDWETFSKACYHLGNRHVKLQIGERWLAITTDRVLEDMLRQMGLQISREQAVFVPEAGAYTGGQHGHHHH